ncbi:MULTISPECIES: hypothetical protein [unclassified Novosphingobium]|uniref:hypothetical protein n=1 Tax=unclassified Novosphingobium TaxID=2644732 RepID=UPI00086B1732|nr:MULTISPECIES: hypothetical protein [unclassified Novosphingobium]MBN9142356.1 hypothetical protein [Novosphingobium sp.]ODU77645.1 MAG: hypothetical protein ABT10_24275 [Novosphingobium sp. SCN 63-17]OJX90164.1 MAG: hypothetical protein BGP00_21450 [Novosphingobium sp. 63-713]
MSAPGPTGYLAYRCPLCCGDNCGNDASGGWDVITQQSVLLGEFDSVWCSQCGDLKHLEEYEITDPDEIAAIDAARAKLRQRDAAEALFEAARWALSVLNDGKEARRRGHDAIAQRKLLDALALAQGGAALAGQTLPQAQEPLR